MLCPWVSTSSQSSAIPGPTMHSTPDFVCPNPTVCHPHYVLYPHRVFHSHSSPPQPYYVLHLPLCAPPLLCALPPLCALCPHSVLHPPLCATPHCALYPCSVCSIPHCVLHPRCKLHLPLCAPPSTACSTPTVCSIPYCVLHPSLCAPPPTACQIPKDTFLCEEAEVLKAALWGCQNRDPSHRVWESWGPSWRPGGGKQPARAAQGCS